MLIIIEHLILESPINDAEDCHIQGLTHLQLVMHKIHSCCVEFAHSNVDGAGLLQL